MSISHTPGPWCLRTFSGFVGGLGEDIFPFRVEDADWVIAEVYGDVPDLRAAAEANARLIAAAPELLAAANEAFDFLGGVDGASEIRATLLAAISKATSRQPEGER